MSFYSKEYIKCRQALEDAMCTQDIIDAVYELDAKWNLDNSIMNDSDWPKLTSNVQSANIRIGKQEVESYEREKVEMDKVEEEHEMDSSIREYGNRDIRAEEQCEWYEVERAIVGNRPIRSFCSNPDNSGGECNHTVCPLTEDINDITEILLQELKDVFHTEGDSISFEGNSLAMLITEIEKVKDLQKQLEHEQVKSKKFAYDAIAAEKAWNAAIDGAVKVVTEAKDDFIQPTPTEMTGLIKELKS